MKEKLELAIMNAFVQKKISLEHKDILMSGSVNTPKEIGEHMIHILENHAEYIQELFDANREDIISGKLPDLDLF